ncbi:MAG: hypothetical protein ACD_15C00189G0006 [uncultured bacterium]|nr:MAG: hypothetical protein ACD_15C00189G0006 [uncultured bacterium]
MENSSCCGNKDASASKVKDPVCGMGIETTEDTLQHAHKGEIYYFCNEGCKNQFIANPEKYLSTATN